MSNIDEDDDAFLYGDDSVNVASNDGAVAANSSAGTLREKSEASKDSKEQGDADDDDGASDEQREGTGENGEEEEDGDESDSDSDSDIEFIIGSEENKEDTGTEDLMDTATTTADAQTASGVVPESIGETAIVVNDEDGSSEPAAQQQSTDATITRVPGIDINKVGDFEGKPITQINLQDLKEKPWRQPGADVSEYFNFGFNELTWTMYCAKQDKLRQQFNPQKAFMELMPMAMMGGMPLPNMPMMPGMPSIPGMPPMPTMPGMPGMPGLPGMPPLPQMPSMPQQQQSQEQQDSSNKSTPSMQIPQALSGPSRYSNGSNNNYNNTANSDFPSGPQRQQEYPRDRGDRDRSERDWEREKSNEPVDQERNDNFREREQRYNSRQRGGSNRRGRRDYY